MEVAGFSEQGKDFPRTGLGIKSRDLNVLGWHSTIELYPQSWKSLNFCPETKDSESLPN